MASSLMVAAFRLPPAALVDPHEFGRFLMARAYDAAHAGVKLAVFPGDLVVGPMGESTFQEFLNAAANAARQLQVAIVPGSFLVLEDEGLVRKAVAIDARGNLVLIQRQTHADPGEHLLLGDKVSVAVLCDIHCALLIGRDPFVPEVARIATLLGADLLIAPLAPAAPYTAEQALTGLWQEVQQNQTFGIESGLYGSVRGKNSDGRAAVLAPCEMTEALSGFLGRPGYFVGHGMITAMLDIDGLQRQRESYPLLRQLNSTLYRKLMPDLYGREVR